MRRLWVGIGLVLGLCSVVAQPLAEVAPEAIVTLSWSAQRPVIETLGDDLAALNWRDALSTLEQLLVYLASIGDDPDVAGLRGLFEALREGDALLEGARAELTEVCPALAEPLAELAAFGREVPFEALLTVSASPFNPVPALTALLRLDGDIAPSVVSARDAALGCLAEADVAITELSQDGVPLYVIDDGGDLPVIISNVGNLFIMGTNPETVRAVVRLAGGSEEPSLARSESYQRARAKLTAGETALGFSLNFAALAEILEGFVGLVVADPDSAYLAERLLAALRTLGSFSAQLSATEVGLVGEGVLAVNPEGGDRALLELLLCARCAVSAPFLAPEGAISIDARYLPWRELLAYVDDWLAGFQDPANRVELRQLVREAFGVDLDAVLFSWLGNELHTYRLEAIGPDVRTLLYAPAQFSVIPVSSVDAARAGLAELGELLAPLFEQLLSPSTLPGNALDELLGGGLLGQRAMRSYAYRGIEITRWQLGLNIDIAYALVGNYLIIGAPARAVEVAIDTFAGGATAFTDPAFVAARAAMPEQLGSYRFSNDRAVLFSLAELFDALVQPLAFAVSGGLGTMEQGAQSGYVVDLMGLTPTPLAVPGSASGVLDSTAAQPEAAIYYELRGLPSEPVTVRVESGEFDTYLRLIDADRGVVLFENDDYLGSFEVSQITFNPEPNVRYWVEVTSPFSPFGGSFEISLAAAEVPVDDLAGAFQFPLALEGIAPLPLAFGARAVGSVVGQGMMPEQIANYYELIGLMPGDIVTVELRSEEFDAYLSLIDAGSSLVIDEDDDSGGFTDSALSFRVEAGVSYWLEVTSFSRNATGAYSLTVSVAPGADVEAVGAPSFAELLALFEQLPLSVRVLAEHVGTSSGYSEVDGDLIYWRTQTDIRW